MNDDITRGTTMTMGKAKFLSAVVVAAALLATVAVARTVHTSTHAPAVHAATGSVPSPAFKPGANFACAPSVARDCESLHWFPE
jgi:hypothetical protein